MANQIIQSMIQSQSKRRRCNQEGRDGQSVVWELWGREQAKSEYKGLENRPYYYSKYTKTSRSKRERERESSRYYEVFVHERPFVNVANDL